MIIDTILRVFSLAVGGLILVIIVLGMLKGARAQMKKTPESWAGIILIVCYLCASFAIYYTLYWERSFWVFLILMVGQGVFTFFGLRFMKKGT